MDGLRAEPLCQLLTGDCFDFLDICKGGDGPVRHPAYFEILKSMVYGGLVESIASLGVVSSAAGGGAAACK